MSTAIKIIPQTRGRNLAGWWRLLAIALVLVLPIPFLPNNVQSIMTKFLIYAIFALSFDLIFGYTGLLSLGHAAFFGVGGYVVGVLSLHFASSSFWIAMPIAIVMAVLVAFVFGFISLRVSGIYFLLLTFALAQLLYSVAWNVPWLNSSGMQGIAAISRPDLGIPGLASDTLGFYYFALVIFAICYYLIKRIAGSTFGHALIGIREGELRMTATGYNTWMFKYLVYIIAAAFAGAAGVLYAYFSGFISPDNQFALGTSFYPMIMAIIGGSGTLYGAVIGAAVVIFVEYFGSLITADRWPLIVGAVFVVSIMFFRAGLAVSIVRWWEKVNSRNGNPAR